MTTVLIEKAIELETLINAEISRATTQTAKKALYCAGSTLGHEVIEWLRSAENEEKKAKQ